MKTNPNKMVLLGLSALLATACADVGLPQEAELLEDRFSSGSSVLDGLPTNDQLPVDIKADVMVPERFDLIQTQTPVLDQGSRGTCVKFAALALMQHLHKRAGAEAVPDLSEAFLQWSVKVELKASPHVDGNNAYDVLQALNTFGVVEEHYWPYDEVRWTSASDPACGGGRSDGQPTQCYTNGEPPYGALHADRWHVGRPAGLNSDPRNIKQALFRTREALILSVRTFRQAWSQASPLPGDIDRHKLGIVSYPNDRDIELSTQAGLSGHAVLLVGWDDDMSLQRRDASGSGQLDEDGEPIVDKGFFLFKNSWGVHSFGRQNSAQAGYGWIPYAYVKKWGRITSATLDDVAPAEQCDTALDEDGNGLAGCDDPACFWEPICVGEPVSQTRKHEVTEPFAIPDDDGSGVGVTSDLVVNDGLEIASLDVEVDVEHAYLDDLRIVLQRMDSSGAVIKEVTLREPDQEDGTEMYPRFAMRFRLDDFNGESTDGRWRLLVRDECEEDLGQIHDWLLEFTAPPVAPSAPSFFYQNQQGQEIPYEGRMTSTIEVSETGVVGGITVAVELLSHQTLAELDGIYLQRINPNVEPTSPDFIQEQVVLLSYADDFVVDSSNPQVSDGKWQGMVFSTHLLDGISTAGTYRLVIEAGELWGHADLERWGFSINTEKALKRVEHVVHVSSAASETGIVESMLDVESSAVIEWLQLKVWVEHSWQEWFTLSLRKIDDDGNIEQEELLDGPTWFNYSGDSAHAFTQTLLTSFRGEFFEGRWQLVVTDLNEEKDWVLDKWALTATLMDE
ncbi:MAG: proprotein convertase P-domain-containing protein [Deltaproteobacteria bacterium]|nr:proprotein convertase P-domain-containing protein [Deltaproteobacteria bacterium]